MVENVNPPGGDLTRSKNPGGNLKTGGGLRKNHAPRGGETKKSPFQAEQVVGGGGSRCPGGFSGTITVVQRGSPERVRHEDRACLHTYLDQSLAEAQSAWNWLPFGNNPESYSIQGRIFVPTNVGAETDCTFHREKADLASSPGLDDMIFRRKQQCGNCGHRNAA